MAPPEAESVQATVKDAEIAGMLGSEGEVSVFDLCFTQTRLLAVEMGTSEAYNPPFWFFGGLWKYADLTGSLVAVVGLAAALAFALGTFTAGTGPFRNYGAAVYLIVLGTEMGVVPLSLFVAGRIARRRSASERRSTQGLSPDRLLEVGARSFGVAYPKIVDVVIRKGSDPVEVELGFYDQEVYVTRKFEIRRDQAEAALSAFQRFVSGRVKVELEDPTPV